MRGRGKGEKPEGVYPVQQSNSLAGPGEGGVEKKRRRGSERRG